MRTKNTALKKEAASSAASRASLQLDTEGAQVLVVQSRRALIFSGHLMGEEITDPADPAATQGAFYFRAGGRGKTQLCVKFSNGAIRVLAES